MEVKVQLNNVRIAPRKSRQVIDVIRGKQVSQARSLLEFMVRRPSDPVLKLLNSAVATATHDLKLQESNLYISKITVDGGPILKRMHPMSRGRGYAIMKRTSHITLVLSEKTNSKPPVVSNIKEKKAKKEKGKTKK